MGFIFVFIGILCTKGENSQLGPFTKGWLVLISLLPLKPKVMTASQGSQEVLVFLDTLGLDLGGGAAHVCHLFYVLGFISSSNLRPSRVIHVSSHHGDKTPLCAPPPPMHMSPIICCCMHKAYTGGGGVARSHSLPHTAS